MLKFWFMYWFSWAYFSFLGKFRGDEKASEFVEYFSFIMHMKDQVKFQLSMRKIAQLFHYIEPRLDKLHKHCDEEHNHDLVAYPSYIKSSDLV